MRYDTYIYTNCTFCPVVGLGANRLKNSRSLMKTPLCLSCYIGVGTRVPGGPAPLTFRDYIGAKYMSCA